KHVNQSCPNLPVKCDKCQKLVPKNEIKSHKEDECVHRIFECPLPDCNTKISFEQFPSHVGKNTPKHVVYLLARIHVLEKQINALDTKLAVGTDSAAAGAVGGAQSVPASHMAGAEGGVSPLSMEDKQQLKLHEDLMAVLHGEILRCIKQVEAMNKKMETQLKSIQENSTKIRELESRGFSATATNQSLPDPLEKGTLIDGKDGMITWRLERFSGVRRDAVGNVQHCICSPSFFSGPVGYKMRVRLFTNGDGEAKGKSISAFIQLMPGPHDDLLPWPFNGKIYFMIVDQKNFRDHKMVSFSALPDQQAFQKPHNEPNIASGLPNLITVTEFSNNQDKYAVGDVLYMRVCVDLHDSVKDKLNTLNPKSFSRRS
ncbi:TNF receptor-associated factor 2, partial [Biomphalaria glabrata]